MKKTLIALMALAGISLGQTTTEKFNITRTDNLVSFELANEEAIITLAYISKSYSTGGNSSDGWENPASYPNTFSPNVQLRGSDNDPTLSDSWTMNFSVKNNGDKLIELTSLTLNVYCINGGGSNKNADITTKAQLTGCEAVNPVSPAWGGLGAATFTFTTPIVLAAGKSTELAFTLNNAQAHNTYAGLASGSISYIPEPATATLSLLALAGLAVRRRRK